MFPKWERLDVYLYIYYTYICNIYIEMYINKGYSQVQRIVSYSDMNDELVVYI